MMPSSSTSARKGLRKEDGRRIFATGGGAPSPFPCHVENAPLQVSEKFGIICANGFKANARTCGKGENVNYKDVNEKANMKWGAAWIRKMRGLAYTGRIHECMNCVIARKNQKGGFDDPVAHLYDSNDMQFALELVDRANEAVEMRKIHHFLCTAIRKSPLAKDKGVMEFVRKLEAFENSCYDLNLISRFSKRLMDAECLRLGGNVEKRKPAQKGKKKAKPRKAAWKEIRYK